MKVSFGQTQTLVFVLTTLACGQNQSPPSNNSRSRIELVGERRDIGHEQSPRLPNGPDIDGGITASRLRSIASAIQIRSAAKRIKVDRVRAVISIVGGLGSMPNATIFTSELISSICVKNLCLEDSYGFSEQTAEIYRYAGILFSLGHELLYLGEKMNHRLLSVYSHRVRIYAAQLIALILYFNNSQNFQPNFSQDEVMESREQLIFFCRKTLVYIEDNYHMLRQVDDFIDEYLREYEKAIVHLGRELFFGENE